MGYLIHFSCTVVTGLFVGVKYSAALTATMLILTPALAFSSSYLTRRTGKLGTNPNPNPDPDPIPNPSPSPNPNPNPDPKPSPGAWVS